LGALFLYSLAGYHQVQAALNSFRMSKVLLLLIDICFFFVPDFVFKFICSSDAFES
jgi:hypothetical protein